jgi:hypothetical protein
MVSWIVYDRIADTVTTIKNGKVVKRDRKTGKVTVRDAVENAEP